ncbi:diaminopimelate decarboxylase [Methylosinus sp. C49]|uniref:alanine racemase n=1 Tax=Methylosinus sp. C49 TaxID=2699395 RepID=UPI001366D80F|nr:alanine racemase [Methylosinus sp. C49]BBU63692.1 diaminopimelate decarboxylase [Methylosinus sp. C49]
MKLSHKLLDRIAAEHGSTFYLLDSSRFRENFEDLGAAFRSYYPGTRIAYSYKTNYVPRFCQIIDQLGGFAEVVSSMELTLARRIGVPDEKIFFNGPYKESAYVKSLLEGGGTVNVDSWDELCAIRRMTDGVQRAPFKLGLRCNFDVQDGVLSRLGFDVLGAAFTEAISLIDADPSLALAGLQCHFATRSLACWENRTKGMIGVIDRLFRDRVASFEFVSLGGGIYGRMPPEMTAQFPVPIPEFNDYAAAAAKPFAEFFRRLGKNPSPVLIVEPGTALVADAMRFVCAVNSIKDVRGQSIVTLSGSSYNINPTPNRKNTPITVFSATEGEHFVERANFAGYTCIEGDYLYKGYTGRLSVGDYVVFDDVGSYSVVMKPPFILPNVAILEPDPDGASYRLIKRRETYEDVFQSYSFE